MYLIWFIPYFIPRRSKKDCKNKHTAWQVKNSAKNLRSPWDIFSPSKPSHTFTESKAPQPLVTSGTHGEQRGTGQVSDCLLWCCCLRVCYMAHSHLGLRILLPQPAECWDYRCKTLYQCRQTFPDWHPIIQSPKDGGNWRRQHCEILPVL